MVSYSVSKKKKKIGKILDAYVIERTKEKRAFEEQLKRLDVQLQNEKIDPDTHERLRDVLEISFVRQRHQALACMQNMFLETLPF